MNICEWYKFTFDYEYSLINISYLKIDDIINYINVYKLYIHGLDIS